MIKNIDEQLSKQTAIKISNALAKGESSGKTEDGCLWKITFNGKDLEDFYCDELVKFLAKECEFSVRNGNLSGKESIMICQPDISKFLKDENGDILILDTEIRLDLQDLNAFSDSDIDHIIYSKDPEDFIEGDVGFEIVYANTNSMNEELHTYKAIFHDGPLSNRKETVLIKANSSTEAQEKAYEMPQSKKYDNLIVSEFDDKVAGYMVNFVGETFINGERTPQYDVDEYLALKSTSESDAHDFYMRKYYGKYCNSNVFDKTKIQDSAPDSYQYIKCGRVKEVYQHATNPDFYNRLESTLTESNETNSEDKIFMEIPLFVLKANFLKNNGKHWHLYIGNHLTEIDVTDLWDLKEYGFLDENEAKKELEKAQKYYSRLYSDRELEDITIEKTTMKLSKSDAKVFGLIGIKESTTNSATDDFKNNLTGDLISDELLNYASNVSHPILDELQDTYGNKISSILVDFEKDWEEAPCDEEGPTPKQEKELDRILDKYADEILSVLKTEPAQTLKIAEGEEDLVICPNCQSERFNDKLGFCIDCGYDEKAWGELDEDTIKKSNGKWVNRGDDGKEHGELKTKKQADAQRKAMFANGYKEGVWSLPKEEKDSQKIISILKKPINQDNAPDVKTKLYHILGDDEIYDILDSCGSEDCRDDLIDRIGQLATDNNMLKKVYANISESKSRAAISDLKEWAETKTFWEKGNVEIIEDKYGYGVTYDNGTRTNRFAIIGGEPVFDDFTPANYILTAVRKLIKQGKLK